MKKRIILFYYNGIIEFNSVIISPALTGPISIARDQTSHNINIISLLYDAVYRKER